MAEFHRAPTEGLTAIAAKALLVAMIDKATRPILDAYPPAERLSWDAKELEAMSALAAEDLAPADYPLLRNEVAAEQAIPAQDVTALQVTAKATSVLAKAAAWRDLISFLSGLRQRTAAAIDAAGDDASRRAAIEAAQVAIATMVAG